MRINSDKIDRVLLFLPAQNAKVQIFAQIMEISFRRNFEFHLDIFQNYGWEIWAAHFARLTEPFFPPTQPSTLFFGTNSASPVLARIFGMKRRTKRLKVGVAYGGNL